MSADPSANEQTPLLSAAVLNPHNLHVFQDDASSIAAESHLDKEEQALNMSAIGERIPYNDYQTIDWVHDLVKDSYRYRLVHSGKGFRHRIYAAFDSASGWIAAFLIGVLTACITFFVDLPEAFISDWKFGFCKRNPTFTRAECCAGSVEVLSGTGRRVDTDLTCPAFHKWSDDWWLAFLAYGGFALLYGVIASGLTMTTFAYLPAAAPGLGDRNTRSPSRNRSKLLSPVLGPQQDVNHGKSMYMAAGSGIPEIKTFLSGFEIPHLLTAKVLVVKAVGSCFAVAAGMCLGKEGPYVHISACIANLVASRFSRYRTNSRKYREILAAAVAAGMSAAFGAPIGGVLFAYEEIATFFPRKTLWRAFVCSCSAAVVLRQLNPTGEGKLILFETKFQSNYLPQHYLLFVICGVAGGVWGGLFCRLNFKWTKWFRSYSIIKKHPVLEVFLVVFVTVLVQYPHPLVRIGGDKIIESNLLYCKDARAVHSWNCLNEARTDGRWDYIGWLVYGFVAKLVLTTITFGTKVPSGVIIPALDAGSFFGRFLGQWVDTISPGIFAMVGAGAFLAGVSKMTISLVVILIELTGQLDYILPHMIAILVAKWVSDSLSKEGVYDLAQTVLGHPFLDPDHAMHLVQRQNPPHLLRRLKPSIRTMDNITVEVGDDNKVPRNLLETKLDQLKRRGLMDAGLVLVKNGGLAHGYLGQAELEFGLQGIGQYYSPQVRVRLLGEERSEVVRIQSPDDEETYPDLSASMTWNTELDLRSFVDRTPLSMSEAAPMEMVVECFSKLGLKHLMITEERSGRLVGVLIKKRLLAYLDGLN